GGGARGRAARGLRPRGGADKAVTVEYAPSAPSVGLLGSRVSSEPWSPEDGEASEQSDSPRQAAGSSNGNARLRERTPPRAPHYDQPQAAGAAPAARAPAARGAARQARGAAAAPAAAPGGRAPRRAARRPLPGAAVAEAARSGASPTAWRGEAPPSATSTCRTCESTKLSL
ncbi:unnamed protein product, partial [Prorocentrum cordatum]